MEMFSILFRTLFFYFFISVSYRIMGKREVGQLGIIDLIVSILIAELVAISIENTHDSIALTLMPILMLVILEVSFAFLSLKFRKFRIFFQGKPALIICDGKINYHELIKQRYSLDDLLLELRSNNIKNLKDVEYAILENNGTLNVFKYDFLDNESTNPFPLIIDGIIQKDTLDYIEKDDKWINKYLKDRSITKEDVFYAFYKNKKIFIILKSELDS